MNLQMLHARLHAAFEASSETQISDSIFDLIQQAEYLAVHQFVETDEESLHFGRGGTKVDRAAEAAAFVSDIRDGYDSAGRVDQLHNLLFHD
jgi:hypothetical protein